MALLGMAACRVHSLVQNFTKSITLKIVPRITLIVVRLFFLSTIFINFLTYLRIESNNVVDTVSLNYVLSAGA
jgi:preprotein translocase subunit SecG